jgi:checkpoint serine/threonine-protein kinase
MVGLWPLCIQTQSNSNDASSKPHPLREIQRSLNPKTGRLEVVFADLQQVYPNRDDPMSVEFSFEELRARHRGWLDMDWAAIRSKESDKVQKAGNAPAANEIEALAPKVLRESRNPRTEPSEASRGGSTPFGDENAPPRVAPAEARSMGAVLAPKVLKIMKDSPKAQVEPREDSIGRDLLLPDENAPPALKVFRESPKQQAEPCEASIGADAEFNDENAPPQRPKAASRTQSVPLKGSIEDDLVINDENSPPSQADVEKAKSVKKARKEERANRTRKIKVMEVKEIRGETQTSKYYLVLCSRIGSEIDISAVQTNLDSPTGRKIRRKKNNKEATMTLHTKEAMDEIYGIFSQPLKENPIEETTEVESDEDVSDDDDDYTSGGESTGTGRLSTATSEFGDETTAADFTLGTTVGDNIGEDDDEASDAEDTDAKSVVSAWSEFTESKHVPEEHRRRDSDDEDEDSDAESFDEIPYSAADPQEREEEHDLVTPTLPEAPHSLPTRFVPVPPEDYDVPNRPYRDPIVAANNRLPFMTPIVEKTESSLGIATAYAQKDYFSAKTPSRSKGTPAILEDDGEPWSSPFQDVLAKAVDGSGKAAKLALREAKVLKEKQVPAAKATVSKSSKPTGPIIQDAQCNPVDEAIRSVVLREIQPPLSSYDGYFADDESSFSKGAEIRKYTKAVTKMGSRASSEKTTTNLSLPPILKFDGTDKTYTVKRELGKGAFAPVYLVESAVDDEQEDQPPQMGKGDFGLKRQALEAVKMEEPPSAWEFYIMRQAKRRLGVSRAADSIVHAYEMHMFRDECYLIEEFRDQGTLLDLVNIARAENNVMDEQLAMFFTIELFRTVEALHTKGLIHGDLKSDNILVRFDALSKEDHWDSQYKRDGRDGWAYKGVSLIDFGRGIDMKVFKPDVQFIADWPTTEADCAEMRELRPWTYQIDYHGLAGIVHNLLFGKYISTAAERAATLGAGPTKTYRIKESLKRYWQVEIWQECFDLLLNPLMHLAGEEGSKMPVLKGMKETREKMEMWLESSCTQGVGLKSLVRRMEEAVKKR